MASETSVRRPPGAPGPGKDEPVEVITYQALAGRPKEAHPGDTIHTPPGEEHWVRPPTTS
ncbi:MULTISPECIES: hypothetical protein [unclassified Streptomyces]|uniref:hypothetical protein n=1 Tax=unclassified Streptomyces TaxID=2593676 RepID=UPI003807C086